jgi:hypothetical protein
MKLRFKDNTLRLRLNQREVQALASGAAVEQCILFPGNASLGYTLHSAPQSAATFENGSIDIYAREREVQAWAESEDIGLYYQFPAAGVMLKVAIEKDLECIDGPPEERDADAFPRTADATC